MGVFTANCCKTVSCNRFSGKTHMTTALLTNGDPFGLNVAGHVFSSQLHSGFGARIVAFASRKSAKKLKRNKEEQGDLILQTSKSTIDDSSVKRENPFSEDDSSKRGDFTSVVNKSEGNSITNPSRSTVLKACSVTSGLIAVLGLAIRQISHAAASGGLPVFDCSEVSFDFEVWHLELIIGLVLVISLSRYTLLKTWPDFAESSEAANRQVLTSLEPLDYVIVAFLPGISEELLFRGGLLPLLGLNWKGALAVGALFGILHLGSGRKFSFAIWATFVGLAYGYATIVSSSLVVPIASHALNNLVGALLWRFSARSSEETAS